MRRRFITERHSYNTMGVIHGMAREAGHEAKRRTGCGFLPRLMEFAGKDIERELGTKTREFYEFVLPPVDMVVQDDMIRVVMDMPGFSKDQIKMRLDGSYLTISAKRDDPQETLYAQRPRRIEKRIRLPTRIKRGEEPECPATLQDGVLSVEIPVQRGGRDISVS